MYSTDAFKKYETKTSPNSPGIDFLSIEKF